jgi:transposase
MSGLQLTATQRRRLEQQLRTTDDAGVFRRTLAILEAAAGRAIADIAQLLRTSRVSVYHWIACYGQTHDPAGLADQRGGNRPTVWTEELVTALAASLKGRPEHFGYQAIEWTVPLLQEHLERWSGEHLSQPSIRRQLHELDYTWKRPRYVLAPDPEREKKTPDSPGNPSTPAALGEVVRGRNRSVAVPAPASGVGAARSTQGGPDLRSQCASRRVWHD